MTPERIAELRKLCKEATPEPWQAVITASQWDIWADDADGESYRLCVSVQRSLAAQSDAAFIATARTALPEALDEIKRLKTQYLEMDAHYRHVLKQAIVHLKDGEHDRAVVYLSEALNGKAHR